MNDNSELQSIYRKRFAGAEAYRTAVWKVLIESFFQRYLPAVGDGSVLDLGCGYGEFINQVRPLKRWAMDLNPDAPQHLDSSVQFLHQDCSTEWALPDESLDVVFTSNFFEHLPDKAALGATLEQAYRCLKPGGQLIAMGPNIRMVPGAYWDFWDHYLALTERSLSEGMRIAGFEIRDCFAQFLPYTMAGGPRYPLAFLKLYLAMPPAWKFLGKQFLVVARKPARTAAQMGRA